MPTLLDQEPVTRVSPPAQTPAKSRLGLWLTVIATLLLAAAAAARSFGRSPAPSADGAAFSAGLRPGRPRVFS